MPDAWFSVPEESRPAPDDRGPDFGDVPIERWWGNRLGSSPRYVVRVWATTAELTALGERSGVAELAQANAVGILNADAPCTIDSNSRLLRSDSE